MILVVGATGQLGSAVVREARRRDLPVRAFVRPGSRHGHLTDLGADLAWGDLRDRASLDAAVTGIDVIVATANAIVPRTPADTLTAVEERGYADLVDAATRSGVRKFVLASVPVTPYDNRVAALRAKRRAEDAVTDSGLDYAIFRLAPFTEVWLALAGTRIAERGEQNPTTQRPFRFLRAFRRVTAGSVEHRGRLLVNGSPETRNAFISIHDVARALVTAATDDGFRNRIVELGGPEALSWNDVAGIVSTGLGKPVRVMTTPAQVLGGMAHLLRPFTRAGADLMAFNAAVCRTSTDWDSTEVVDALDLAPLRTVEQVFKEKLALPAA